MDPCPMPHVPCPRLLDPSRLPPVLPRVSCKVIAQVITRLPGHCHKSCHNFGVRFHHIVPLTGIASQIVKTSLERVVLVDLWSRAPLNPTRFG
jgi:hypothetical protein